MVGGLAEYFTEPLSVTELQKSLRWAEESSQAVTILGGGTNVLISDQGVPGLTVCLRKLTGAKTEVRESVLKITCLAGTSKSELLKIFLKYKLAPALFLAGLPGDVGGGVVMNAGVGEQITPREFVQLVEWIDVLKSDFSTVRHPVKDLHWSYRHCSGWQPGVITQVGLSWPLQPVEDILAKVKHANHVRLSKQPLDQPSCGSVFVNPAGHKSGQLIEAAGLKGFSCGGAKVSEKHANFIVNFNQASAQDIHQVITHVQTTVKAKSGVDLKTEVVYLGQW